MNTGGGKKVSVLTSDTEVLFENEKRGMSRSGRTEERFDGVGLGSTDVL